MVDTWFILSVTMVTMCIWRRWLSRVWLRQVGTRSMGLSRSDAVLNLNTFSHNDVIDNWVGLLQPCLLLPHWIKILRHRDACMYEWTTCRNPLVHYSDVIMSAMASHFTSVLIVCSTVCSGTDQRKQASLTYVRGTTGHRWIPLTIGQERGKMFPFDDVIMDVIMVMTGAVPGHCLNPWCPSINQT